MQSISFSVMFIILYLYFLKIYFLCFVLVCQADLSLYNEFRSWKDDPTMDRTCPFLDKIYQEDIFPCLTFSKSEVTKNFFK